MCRLTFFTSARSLFLSRFSLISAMVWRDFDPADSLPDSEQLSDSDVLLDSECWECACSLPCSLSDWLPDSEPERFDSSDAELLYQKRPQSGFSMTEKNSHGHCTKNTGTCCTNWSVLILKAIYKHTYSLIVTLGKRVMYQSVTYNVIHPQIECS